MSLRKSKVHKEWSPTFAYAIGLIVADGNLSKDGRHIDFTSKDNDLVMEFQKCLGINTKISKKTRAHETIKRYYHTQFGDKNFYDYLVHIGITPAKSKTIGIVRVPKKYFFDYLRGYFDGDGTIYSYWDKRWKHSFMFYVAFASASLSHLRWLRATNKKYLGIEGHIRPSRRSFALTYAKRESRILIKKMFYSEDLPCLKRKFIKIRRILSVK